ncbi:MAG: MFS transporter [Myxococcota bacterium]
MDARTRGIVAATFAAQAVAIGSTIGAFSLFVRPVAEAFSASTLAVSAGVSIITLMLGVSGVPVGLWLDRGTPRHAMFAGTFVLSTGFWFASQAESLASLALLCVYIGGAVPTLGPLTTMAVVGKAVADGRGRALGIANMGVPLGGLLFAALAGVVIESWGWRTALQLFSIVTAVVCVPAVFFGIPRELHPATSETVPEAPEGAPTPLAWNPAFWLAALAFGAGVGVLSSWYSQVGPFLDDMGLGSRQAGLLLAFSQGIAVIGTLALGALADRVPPSLIMGSILAVVGLGFGVLATGPGLPWVIATLVITGVATGGTMPVFAALLAKRFGAGALGSGVGLANVCLLPFGAALPLLAGAIRDAQGSYASFLFVCLGLVVVALGLLVASVRRSDARSA